MLRFILHRLFLSVLTIFGVMLITFLLFRVVSGDIAAAFKGAKATEKTKAEWRQSHDYDKPLLLNLHRQLTLTDTTTGDGILTVKDAPGSQVAEEALMFYRPLAKSDRPQEDTSRRLIGRYALGYKFLGLFSVGVDAQSPLKTITEGKPLVKKTKARPDGEPASASNDQPGAATAGPAPAFVVTLVDKTKFTVDLTGAEKVGDVIDAINDAPGNNGKLIASMEDGGAIWDSQFIKHIWTTLTFSGRSLTDTKTLWSIIKERAPYSLALTLPVFAIQWMLALGISSIVAYYRGQWIDKLGVFLTVLGMCIPFLAFMIYGQWFMFTVAPQYAYGHSSPLNFYAPIFIMVVAGLGAQVRFYRTIILDETHRDYVRTARAKGLPLPTIMFKHILRNCMLPILTSLILAIPFLIMGSLLAESMFGIPGLGDLMLSSINGRNEPIINAMVFLTAVIYTFGILLTDICYAIFDPRIRLK